MLLQVVILTLSIVALYFGAELALEAAEKVGHYFGFSPLIIGLVLVGFGTSLPEFFVSHIACMNGQPGIALGNIIGSNIANLFFNSRSPLASWRHFLWWDKKSKTQLYLHLLLTSLLAIVTLYVGINYYSVAILLGFFVFYLWRTLYQMTKRRTS